MYVAFELLKSVKFGFACLLLNLCYFLHGATCLLYSVAGSVLCVMSVVVNVLL